MITNEIDKRDIVTINLKYGSGLKPLKTLAFAQLSAKTLFLCGQLETTELAKEIARLIGVKNVSEDLIIKGLEYLVEINKVINKNDKWILRDEVKKEIAKDLDLARIQIKGVLKRHFPIGIEEEKKIRAWFKEASASFFSYYGDEWVSAISKKTDKKVFLRGKTIDELLQQSIKNFNLDGIKPTLVDGFIKFLSSDDISDQQYLMLISQAMFSARLVAADIGVDPIALQELKDSKFILDTNVLFPIALENSKLSKAINSLEGALKTINANLVYLCTTKEEYGRALSGKRGEIIHLTKIFPNAVLQDADDDFMATAKARGCVSKEDYERFFDSIVTIPEKLPDGYKIALEDNNKIEEVKKKAEEDKDLKNNIQKYALKIRPYWRGPKSESALKHDAALVLIAEFIKSEEKKCWILSLDKSLQAYTIDRVGPHEIPILIRVPALIEILAINNAGPELDATNFAPLLAKIILNECTPPLNTYKIQDLNALYKINEKAAELPPEDIKEIAKEITKARIEGKSVDSTELQLKVNRMFQDSTIHITEKLEEARKRAEIAEADAKNERKQRKVSENLTKVNEIKSQALKKLLIQVIGGIFFAGLISVLLLWLYRRFFDPMNKKEIIGYLLATAPLIIDAWKVIPKAIAEYKKTHKEVRDVLSKEE